MTTTDIGTNERDLHIVYGKNYMGGEVSMSNCKDCKYCDLEALENRKWYCHNSDVIVSAMSIYDLPVDSEHSLWCFERKE